LSEDSELIALDGHHTILVSGILSSFKIVLKTDLDKLKIAKDKEENATSQIL
jgi:2-C-methyl-D-erythritol 4-phosphate cytidylyltransferase